MSNVTGGQFLSGSGISSANALGTLIQTQTLGSAAASVTFSSIPQTYTTLKLFVSATVVTAGFLQVNFNGDATAANYFINYQTQSFTATVTPVGAFSSAGSFLGSLNVATTGTGGAEVTFPGYSSTTSVKANFAMSVGSSFFYGGGIWNSAAAITSIVLVNSAGGNFNAGSVFSLYGIK